MRTSYFSREREERNRRGKIQVEYECACGDFQKNGRIDCEHVFAERLRRGEVVVEGTVERKRMVWATATRRPSRKRFAAGGRSMRSIQRDARVAIPERVPELLRDLAGMMQSINRENLGTRAERRNMNRAFALVFKIVHGKSNDEMQSVYGTSSHPASSNSQKSHTKTRSAVG